MWIYYNICDVEDVGYSRLVFKELILLTGVVFKHYGVYSDALFLK